MSSLTDADPIGDRMYGEATPEVMSYAGVISNWTEYANGAEPRFCEVLANTPDDEEVFLVSAPLPEGLEMQVDSPLERFALDCLQRQVVTKADFEVMLTMLRPLLPQTKRTKERINMSVMRQSTHISEAFV